MLMPLITTFQSDRAQTRNTTVRGNRHQDDHKKAIHPVQQGTQVEVTIDGDTPAAATSDEGETDDVV